MLKSMLKIVKIGGNIVDNSVKLRAFLTDFAALEGSKILVHGGGKVATAIAAALGIETVMIEGRRVTDERMLEVVTMVYSGINKQIVSALQGLGCNAVGLSGADGKLILSRRRPAVTVKGKPIDYGFVGDPVSVNAAFLQLLISYGVVPVILPITLGESGQLLNTNADTIASTVAVAMSTAMAEEGVELVYCFEKQGVMADMDDPNSLVERIDAKRFAELKAEGTIHSGMIPKLDNAFSAINQGVSSVVICAAENIAKPGYGGTTIVA